MTTPATLGETLTTTTGKLACTTGELLPLPPPQPVNTSNARNIQERLRKRLIRIRARTILVNRNGHARGAAGLGHAVRILARDRDGVAAGWSAGALDNIAPSSSAATTKRDDRERQ